MVDFRHQCVIIVVQIEKRERIRMNTQNDTINQANSDQPLSYITMCDMTFENAFQNDIDNIFDDYQSYIMDNADPSEVIICNGDTLLEAAENEYLLEEFKQSWIDERIYNV